jgi:hypothetical protein
MEFLNRDGINTFQIGPEEVSQDCQVAVRDIRKYNSTITKLTFHVTTKHYFT